MSKSNNIILFIILFIATIFCGSISTLMGMYLKDAANASLKLVNENTINRFGAILNSIFILGCSIGGFCIGVISDKIGRKKATILSIFF